ncbi:MBL fold metallo-hydrolase [Pedobacter sp. 22163]|uniref:MBL fold metallo-hydrolase n=1 Tax=Pedobacter sp. 22163 TaxID=3453883 RepID=UPI003F87628E
MKTLKIAFTTMLLSSVFFGKAQTVVTNEQPGYYFTKVGNAQVITLLDGMYALNVNEHLHGVSLASIKKTLYANHLDSTVELTFSAFLVHVNNELILVDAGSGSFMGQDLGKITKNLKLVGFDPKDITAVLITHGHADHIGGIVNGNERTFPNATVYISKPESVYWLNPENKKKSGKGDEPYFAIAESALKPYIDAGKVKTFNTGEQLLAGISSVDIHGHTPGQSAYLLSNAGKQVLFMAIWSISHPYNLQILKQLLIMILTNQLPH